MDFDLHVLRVEGQEVTKTKSLLITPPPPGSSSLQPPPVLPLPPLSFLAISPWPGSGCDSHRGVSLHGTSANQGVSGAGLVPIGCSEGGGSVGLPQAGQRSARLRKVLRGSPKEQFRGRLPCPLVPPGERSGRAGRNFPVGRLLHRCPRWSLYLVPRLLSDTGDWPSPDPFGQLPCGPVQTSWRDPLPPERLSAK